MSPRQKFVLVLIVTICLLIPSILLVICIACRLHLDAIHRRRLHVFRETSSSPQSPFMIIPLPAAGLDDCTIQSYPKEVFAESGRLNGLSCPICLAEYSAGESVRSIPQCQHFFHAECVDEWLKMKATCPVCRNSPLLLNIDKFEQS